MNISAPIWKYIPLLLLVGIFIWRCAVRIQPPEPQYQGKKLTDWAKEIDPTDFFRQPEFQQHKAQSELAIAAIRRIGTNALPVALQLCAAQDSWFKRKYEAWIQEHGDEEWMVKPPFKINFIPADEQRFEGVNIIWALGPAAKPAIPRLIQLFQSSDQEVAEDMMDALPGVSTNVVPSLIELLRSADKAVRVRAAILLGRYFGSQAHAAVPVLLECLDDPNLNLVRRVKVIHALGFITGDASVIVPALIRHAQKETNWLVLNNDFGALENLGTNATAAVPFLVHILANPDLPDDRPPKSGARRALEKIDAEAAKPFLTNTLDFVRTPSSPIKNMRHRPNNWMNNFNEAPR